MKAIYSSETSVCFERDYTSLSRKERTLLNHRLENIEFSAAFSLFASRGKMNGALPKQKIKKIMWASKITGLPTLTALA
jgi:hypothetical protein